MPQRTETINISDIEQGRIASLVYGAFKHLGWNVKYAGPNAIIAYTPKKWSSYDDEVTARWGDNEMEVTSRLIHNESFDMMGKNKKHLAAFISAFQHMKGAMTAEQQSQWDNVLVSLREETLKQAEIESKEAEEIDKVMNLSKGNMNLSYLLIAANVIMFVITAISGVSVISPRGGDLLPWGANYAPLTYNGEWWRLFTSMFLHFGVIHLAVNMVTLYFIGSNLEPMLGKGRFLVSYICAGLMGSVASLWWHSDGSAISAGASGAIFGIAGVFLALLTTNLIPASARKGMLQSIGIFVAYNIFNGLKENSGVDNAAHLGGLIGGMVIGYAYFLTLRPGAARAKTQVVTGLISLATVMIVFMSLRAPANDNLLFQERYEEFGKAEEAALKPIHEDNLTVETIDRVSLPEWRKAKEAADKMQAYDLNTTNRFIADKLGEYVDLRIELTQVMRKALEENSNAYDEDLTDLVGKINGVLEDLKNPPQ